MRYAVIERATAKVVNVAELNDPSEWPVPEGFLVVASDAANIGVSYDEASGTFSAPAVVSPPPTQREYVMAVQAVLDAKAQERDYDNIFTACTYVGSAIARFNAEAVALRAWRDNVWNYCAAQLSLVLSGQQQQPTVTEFVATLPAFSWPD